MPKRIAVLPFNRGLAHVLRSLMIAKAAQQAGHKTRIWLPENYHSFAASAKIPVTNASPLMHSDIGSAFEDHLNPAFIQSHAEIIRHELSAYKPDAVLIDFHLPALVAARSLKLPTYYVTHTTGLPGGFRLPAIGMPELPFTPFRPLLEATVRRSVDKYSAVLQNVLRDEYAGDDDIFSGVKYIIPEPRGYMRARKLSAPAVWCGPLLWEPFETQPLPPNFPDFPKDQTIYVTSGGTGFNTEFTQELCNALIKAGYYVIVTGGGKLDISALTPDERLFAADFLPGGKIMPRVRAVVCHGGYGTLVQAAQAGTPALSLPVNSEQIIHAARWQQLGLGRMLWPILSPSRLKAALKNDLASLESLAHRIPSALAISSLAKLPLTVSSPLEFDAKPAPALAATFLND